MWNYVLSALFSKWLIKQIFLFFGLQSCVSEFLSRNKHYEVVMLLNLINAELTIFPHKESD
jgi:hypothetical protein